MHASFSFLGCGVLFGVGIFTVLQLVTAAAIGLPTSVGATEAWFLFTGAALVALGGRRGWDALLAFLHRITR